MGPLDLHAWIEAHREQLRPPVGNARLFEDGSFIIMVVGGPNARADFHVDPHDELFFQIEGDIELVVIEAGVRRRIPIRQGQLYLLPAGVPHSPQRPAGTVGLVVERVRSPGELDGLRWFCASCGSLVHEVRFEMQDIVTQIRGAIDALEANEAARTCGRCGAVLDLSAPL